METTGKIVESATPISLYFHIPFCSKKCPYCHFYVIPDKEEDKKLLLESLLQEWQYYLPQLKGKKIVSIYFGGGTPFLFGPDRVKILLDTIYHSEVIIAPNIEITLEVNPENATFNWMKAYKECGVNRISIGVQSFDKSTLEVLGRTHDVDRAISAIYNVYRSGIQQISIDLMYEIPHQKVKRWVHELQILKELPITHLSLYNLTFEPHTIFYKKKETLLPFVPSDEENVQMLHQAIEAIEEAGLKRYEISAFCKDGLRSIHNAGYWLGRPFIGLGPSAFSYFNKKRFRNIANLKRYAMLIKEQKGQWIDFEEELPLEDAQNELFAINLRLLEGVKLSAFQEKHGVLFPELKKKIDRLIQKGSLAQKENVITLTDSGMLFYDSVASEII